ncbi:Methyltransferase-like protein [Aphelenchoides bicaudatus]|nr:Methyltransferase-like protein [Aphelenchoides bicaudatus]
MRPHLFESFNCKLTSLILLIAMKFGHVNAIECFDCTNYPSKITCTAAAECEGVGCYFILSSNSTFWTASCSNSISITDRQTSCYKIPDGDEYCVCFKDFCNTPAEIEKAVDLRHTPFTSEPTVPWAEATTSNPHSTTPTRPTILVNTIPTTLLLGKPPESDDDSPDHQITAPGDQSATTINPPITSVEPRVHFANNSVLINDTAEAAGKALADEVNNSNNTQTSLDDEIGVTEPNSCPQVLLNIYAATHPYKTFFKMVLSMENSSQFEDPRTLTKDELELLKNQTEMTPFKKNKLEADAKKNWDQFYKRNSTNFFKDRHWSKNEMGDIFDDIDLKQNLVFLEAGCGVGNMLFPLIEYFPSWQFIGFDFSSKAIEHLQARSKEENIEGVCAKVLDITTGKRSDLDFPPADLATFIFVLSALHPDKFDQAIQNLATFIKPGGSVFIRDYGATDHAMIRFGKGNKISDRFYSRQDGTRVFYFYKEELQSLFERNGFTTHECEYLFKKTINYEKKLNVDRVFVQGRFVRAMNHHNNHVDLVMEQDGPSTSWLFSLEHLDDTPSRRVDISEKDENKKRRESVKMIRDIGTGMKMSMQGAIATANIAVLGCLFLAGKVEETPKKCKDIITNAQAMYPENDVMDFEKILLHTLRFDLQVEHPYQYLLEYIKIFQMDDNVRNKVMNFAWAFVNDSYFTTLCLMWEPEVIAISLLRLAINMAHEHKGDVKYADQNMHPDWWTHFVEDLHLNTIEIIEQIIKNSYKESATP